MVINGIDYPARMADLQARGIDPEGDDTAFGAEVFCNQHRRMHSTGWCTVSNVEKFAPDEPRPVRAYAVEDKVPTGGLTSWDF